MDQVKYPDSLILLNADINIFFENNSHYNKTRACIVVEGNQNGFLSLSNLINVYNVYLYDKIVITEFPFVHSNIKLEIIEETDSEFSNGYILKENDRNFKWKISETNLFMITGMLHSLGYANNELHFDADLKQSDISVYCIVK